MTHRVFVFGTLKEGFPNFATNKGRRIAGNFVTLERYPFYLVGERHSPWLIDLPGEGERVIGQVFEVDDATLAAMDVLERIHEPDGYRRVRIPVEPDGVDDPAPIDVFAYIKQVCHFDRSQARLGPLREYTLEQAALYQSRCDLDRVQLRGLLLEGALSLPSAVADPAHFNELRKQVAEPPGEKDESVNGTTTPGDNRLDRVKLKLGSKSAAPPAAGKAASFPASPSRWCGWPGR